MSEGGLGAPVRHRIDWQDPDFYDPEKLAAEERRVFDICHSCRRCFNLCDAFPRLFDLIDESETMELDSVPDSAFQQVADACTLCDMCFMTKCPYVPPHEFDVDFPHLMLRHRAVEQHQGRPGFADRALTETDRNGRLAGRLAPLTNWANRRDNHLTRPALERIVHVHRDAALPAFHRDTLLRRADRTPAVNTAAPAHGRRAVLYATCFGNYNNPDIGEATRAVLTHNGVETEVAYPGCCGMPKLEQGDLEAVAAAATRTADALLPWVDDGYRVIALVPSCALMLKFEWPLIVDDPRIQRLAENTMDVAEYVVDIARNEGLADGLQPLEGGVSLHLACHARAQNMGPKAADMLRLIPDIDLDVQERCSGHGGAWGVKKENFEVAIKVGRPLARRVFKSGRQHLASECPLAGAHIVQGLERQAGDGDTPPHQSSVHPIQLLAQAYGLA
ncbi:Anaerobic glycerol-3-phosphate dehydrogenase subunit C [wastewater metagenome]|uniref:Anaerobic glycerol-3-phosphate dehydrogenase subunit C n=3 Tax=root TaxID=1 RepID=A0A5B8R6F4_9ZZZZ|nr:heterodisulfide reductase-related iron-sulfur binding cluster [Arhodomonas aquaeolei]MCS4504023.1 heterodisulfide reductase-related iron-sulfur binding cluster [Arhodomonas aquaeolei]QEA04200.1 anaerobic glycerol-3-phosphate dehydrogenase subunit C [uncultured organism]